MQDAAKVIEGMSWFEKLARKATDAANVLDVAKSGAGENLSPDTIADVSNNASEDIGRLASVQEDGGKGTTTQEGPGDSGQDSASPKENSSSINSNGKARKTWFRSS
jgi:hypothetical protein